MDAFELFDEVRIFSSKTVVLYLGLLLNLFI